MDIKNFVESCKGWSIATKEDNQKVLELYSSLSMSGGVFNLRFVKDPDYFRYCQYESPNHYVLIAKNGDGDVEGLVSLMVRPCYLNGKKEYVGHFSDLRVKRKKDRKGDFSWTELGTAFLKNGKDIKDINGCHIYIGSYVASNKYAIQAIKDNSPWGISELATYTMLNIPGRRFMKTLGLKWRKNPGMKFSIRMAKGEDIPQLKEFLDGQNRKRALGFVFEGRDSELERRFRDWDDFSIENFFIARDENEKIIGCFAHWDPGKGRRIIVSKYPTHIVLIGKVVKLFGKKTNIAGSELDILFITHLELLHGLSVEQKRYLLNKLLDALYASGITKNYHLVALCDYNNEDLTRGMEKNYFIQKTTTILYQLYDRDTAGVPVVKESELEHHVGHEMVLT